MKIIRSSAKPKPTPTTNGAGAPQSPPNEIDGLPRKQGPTALPSHLGINEYLEQGEPIMLTLTPGQYRWVWEVAEGKAIHQYHMMKELRPEFAASLRDTIVAMRTAGHEHFTTLRPKRVLRRGKQVHAPSINRRVIVKRKTNT